MRRHPGARRAVVIVIVAAAVAASCGGGNAEDHCAAIAQVAMALPESDIEDADWAVAMQEVSRALEDAAASAPDATASEFAGLATAADSLAADPAAPDRQGGEFALALGINAAVDTADCPVGFDELMLARTGLGTGDPTLTDPPPRRDPTELTPDALAAINDLVPESVDVEFISELITQDDRQIVAAVPVGWTPETRGAQIYVIPHQAGHFASYTLAAACPGICAPRTWREAVEGDVSEGTWGLPLSEGEVVVDETLSDPPGRLVVLLTPDDRSFTARVVLQRYRDHNSAAFVCRFVLGPTEIDYWEAFAAACESAVPLWLPVDE